MNKPVLIFQSHTHMLFGGGEFSMLALLEDAADRGYEVHVIVPDTGKFARAAKKTGATVHIIRSYWWTYNKRNEFEPALHLKAIQKTRRLIKRLKPLACITNTLTSPWLALAARAEGYPHIWILREYGDTDHGLTFWLPKKDIGRAVSGMSAKIFANSETLKDHYAKLTGRRDIGIITPHVSQPSTTATQSPFKARVLKLVCVGNFSEGKGQLDAAKAVKKIKDSGQDVQLMLVGLAAQVWYKEKIEKFVVQNGLENDVIFTGYQKNPADYVKFADFNLVCSRTETFGRVTIESLLLGTPVVGTDSANTKKLLGGKKELLYKFGDSGQLADKITWLAAHRNFAKKATSELQKTVRQKYSAKNAHAQLFDYLQTLDPAKNPEPQGDYEPLKKVLLAQLAAEKRKPLARRLAKKTYKFARRQAGKAKRAVGL